MGREDLMLIAMVYGEPRRTMLKIKRSGMPVKVFKRIDKRLL